MIDAFIKNIYRDILFYKCKVLSQERYVGWLQLCMTNCRYHDYTHNCIKIIKDRL